MSTLRHHWVDCQLLKVRRRYSQILLVHDFLSGPEFMSLKLVWNDQKCLVKGWSIGWQWKWSHRFDAAYVSDMISDLMISHVGCADNLPAFPPKAFQSWSLLFGESLPVQHLGLWQWPVIETLLACSWYFLVTSVCVSWTGWVCAQAGLCFPGVSWLNSCPLHAVGMWTCWEDTRDDSEANQHYTSYSNPLEHQFQPSSTAHHWTPKQMEPQRKYLKTTTFSLHGCTLRYFRQLLSRQDVVAKPQLQQLLGVERPPPVTASIRRFGMVNAKRNMNNFSNSVMFDHCRPHPITAPCSKNRATVVFDRRCLCVESTLFCVYQGNIVEWFVECDVFDMFCICLGSGG